MINDTTHNRKMFDVQINCSYNRFGFCHDLQGIFFYHTNNSLLAVNDDELILSVNLNFFLKKCMMI